MRHLLRSAGKATLATVAPDGSPFASLVTIATDQGGAPLLLLSRLAEHRRNILKDERVSLLVDGTDGFVNPQAGPRATFTGRARVSAEPSHRSRFLARQPAAKLYAGFSDFEILRIDVARVHWVGGFARATWVEFVPVPDETAQGIAGAEAEILAHMNEDHRETIQRYAHQLLRRRGTRWRMAGCDADGCDLAQGGRVVRLAFERPAGSVDEIRARLVALAKLTAGHSP